MLYDKKKEDEKLEVYERFFKNNYKKIIHLCKARGQSNTDSDEIAAESLIRLYNIWDERWMVSEVENLKWLYVTAQNIIYEYGRKNERTKTEPLSALAGMTDEAEIENIIIEGEQYTFYLNDIKKELDETEWELFSMVFMEKMTYQEIIDKLSLSNEALRARIYRLRKKLKPYMKKLFDKNK